MTDILIKKGTFGHRARHTYREDDVRAQGREEMATLLDLQTNTKDCQQLSETRGIQKGFSPRATGQNVVLATLISDSKPPRL